MKPSVALALLAAVSGSAGEVRFKLPGAVVLEITLPKSGTAPEWVEAKAAGHGGSWWFGHQVVVQTAPGLDAAKWLGAQSDSLPLVLRIRPDLVIAEAPDAVAAIGFASGWAALPGVVAAYPVCRQPVSAGSAFAPAPTDDFFPARVANVAGQWYLENRDPLNGTRLGADLNVRAAWPVTRGEGVTVAVGDVGIELGHPELQPALLGAPHRNFAFPGGSANPVLGGTLGAHGTSIAGLIAATPGNSVGMSGIAPSAKVASWVVFDSAAVLVSDARLSEMYRFSDPSVAIQNHSWGTGGDVPQGPTALESAALDSAYSQGRGGLGTVMVRIAGNRRTLGGNANDDGWGNDPHAIQVASVRPDGRVASYSNPGASILVAAPGGDYDTGGLFTTDLTGFAGANLLGFLPPFEYLGDFRFNALGMIGTSAAAPLVSGTVALMLSATPRLSVRDVRTILALSAVQWDTADPGLQTNAAGLRVGHNTGFGVVDAGDAVRLSRTWPGLPAATNVPVTVEGPFAVADDSLRVEVTGDGIPAALASVRCLPSNGLHPDSPTEWLPLVDLGVSTNRPAASLAGKGALIERGGPSYAAKLGLAAEAGAAFAVLLNNASGTSTDCPPGDQLCPLGGVEFAAIPAVFIGHSDGVALRELARTNASARVRLATRPAVVHFDVAASLRCESVRLRLRTNHPLRGDLRVTLRSPSGTRSLLQAYNADETPGPKDWTYSSTLHLFEPTEGIWTLEVTDEGAGSSGDVLGATLLLEGVAITDADHDGLDDAWERHRFGGLGQGPAGDPDEDGWTNLRESVAGTDPLVRDRPDGPSIGEWNPGMIRVSLPAIPGVVRTLLTGTRLDALTNRVDLVSPGTEASAILPVGDGVRFVRLPASSQ